jgi:hypothetical protein
LRLIDGVSSESAGSYNCGMNQFEYDLNEQGELLRTPLGESMLIAATISPEADDCEP